MKPIERKRLAAGLTQTALADKVGVTPGTVSRWESGSSIPSPEMYPKLAEVLNIPAEEVVRLFAPLPEAEAATAGS